MQRYPTHRYVAVDVALVGLLDDEVDERLHVLLTDKGGPELGRVPHHEGEGHHGGGVPGSELGGLC